MHAAASPTLLLLAACGGEPAAGAPTLAGAVSTGSRTLIASADLSALYVAHADEGVVSRYDVASGEVDTLDVGGEPTRLARVGDRILATLRAERSIAVIEDRGGALALAESAATGTEPLGIVASADGGRVYVALSTQDEVHELDAELAVVRRFTVPGRPSWLALHPSAEALYVGSAVGGTLTYIDLDEAEPVPEAIAFPELIGAGRGMDLPLGRRLTGDPSFSPTGDRLAVPGLWVDDVTEPRGNHGEEGSDPGERYESLGLGLSPNNPGIALFDVDAHGRPVTGGSRVVYAVAYAPGATLVVRSYLASVAYSPDGALLLGAMEASDVVLALGAGPEVMTEGEGGFMQSPTTAVAAGAGPRGVAFVAADRAWVHGFLDRSIAEIDPRAAVAGTPIVLTAATLDPVVEQGRRLFYAANDPRVVVSGAGLSCSTCHFEGRNDGLTWPVDSGIRQTPSLAGPVSLSAPFTWTGNVATVAEECRITSQERLGGADITDGELDALAAFVDFTRDVDHPLRGATSAAIVRGRELFARADVDCASCHLGPRFTDHEAHDLFGLTGVDTQSLVGIAASAPYLHDGSAATLRDVLELSRTGAMGDTSALSEDELADLEAYLRSL